MMPMKLKKIIRMPGYWILIYEDRGTSNFQ
jgi:hypothetical protein